LSYTDQSGYFLPGLFKSIGKAFANIFRAVGQMHARQSAAVSCYCQAAQAVAHWKPAAGACGSSRQ
jgi:hypothetical protein